MIQVFDKYGNLKVTSTVGNVNTFIEDEIPSGVINNINDTFTLLNTPIIGSLLIYLNGLRLKNNNDFTYIGNIITMINIPYISDSFLCDYQY